MEEEKIKAICEKLIYFTDRWKDYGRRMRDSEHTLIVALDQNPLEDFSMEIGPFKIKSENGRLEVDGKIEPVEPVTMKTLVAEDAPVWAKAGYLAASREEE